MLRTIHSQHFLNSELKQLETPFLSTTDDPRLLWLKYQILMYFEDFLKKQLRKKSEKQKIFVFNQKSIKSIKINVHTVMEQAYKVFDYA